MQLNFTLQYFYGKTLHICSGAKTGSLIRLQLCRVNLPAVDAAGYFLDGFSFLLQLLRHGLETLPVVSVCIL